MLIRESLLEHPLGLSERSMRRANEPQVQCEASTEGPRRLHLERHVRAVDKTVTYMREHFADPLTLDTLANLAAMSKFHYVRTFEQLTGTPPRCFLACLRIEQAKRLLQSSDLAVTDICSDVGYASLGTFSQAFTTIVGMSPSAYRKFSNLEPDPVVFVRRCQAYLEAQRESDEPGVAGMVEPIDDLESSVIFVGAFARGAPLGRPEVGTLLMRAGRFQMRRPTSANFHLLAVRLPISSLAPFSNAALQVSGVASQRCQVSDLVNRELPRLKLRAPSNIDPPLLIELGTLL